MGNGLVGMMSGLCLVAAYFLFNVGYFTCNGYGWS